jgi:predicted nucleic acid-binding protein
MIVVSDTSPINYLVLIEFQDLLPKLFGRILIPKAVERELRAHGTPEPVRQFVASAPDWLEVRSAPEVPATLEHLDSGEREALALALAVGAELILLDERKGRQAAENHGLQAFGTLGVIGFAAERQLVALEDALALLQKTSFRVSPRLLKSVREGTASD